MSAFFTKFPLPLDSILNLQNLIVLLNKSTKIYHNNNWHNQNVINYQLVLIRTVRTTPEFHQGLRIQDRCFIQCYYTLLQTFCFRNYDTLYHVINCSDQVIHIKIWIVIKPKSELGEYGGEGGGRTRKETALLSFINLNLTSSLVQISRFREQIQILRKYWW